MAESSISRQPGQGTSTSLGKYDSDGEDEFSNTSADDQPGDNHKWISSKSTSKSRDKSTHPAADTEVLSMLTTIMAKLTIIEQVQKEMSTSLANMQASFPRQPTRQISSATTFANYDV